MTSLLQRQLWAQPLFTPLRRLCRRVARGLTGWARREDGSATIEFVIFVPITIFIFMASMEAGFYMIRHAMMERGLDLALRDYRLGRMTTLNHDQIRDLICAQTPFIHNCQDSLKVWMQTIDLETWVLPDNSIYCGDRNNPLVAPAPPGTIDYSGANEIVLVRVCSLEQPIFPTSSFSSQLRADSRTGAYELATTSIVVTEPR